MPQLERDLTKYARNHIYCVPEYYPDPKHAHHSIVEYEALEHAHFFAVVDGYITGIYTSMEQVKQQVETFDGALYNQSSTWVAATKTWRMHCRKNHDHTDEWQDSSPESTPQNSPPMSPTPSRSPSAEPTPVSRAILPHLHEPAPAEVPFFYPALLLPTFPPMAGHSSLPPAPAKLTTMTTTATKSPTKRVGGPPPKIPSSPAKWAALAKPTRVSLCALEQETSQALEAEDVLPAPLQTVYAVSTHRVVFKDRDVAFSLLKKSTNAEMLYTDSAVELLEFFKKHGLDPSTSKHSFVYALSGCNKVLTDHSAAFHLLQESDGGRMFYAKSASEVELFFKKYNVK
ncbi:hypothetical protein C8R44DRAFT_886651 [Mycena epipterygia]|nr:hypothetical protein C8R44DRAFT_886651 [Mycena epipterygia]